MASSVTLHSSWRGLVLGFVGSSLLFAAGAAGVSAGGTVLAWGVLVLGTVLMMVVLFDVPVASEFDSHGVTRRPLLRRHRLDWSRVDQLTRARPGIAAAARDLKPGGLTAKVGRRRYVLVDQCESNDEFEALYALLDEAGHELGLDDLIVPPSGIDPTFTYRRRRWQA